MTSLYRKFHEALHGLLAFTRTHGAGPISNSVTPDESAEAKIHVDEALKWLSELRGELPYGPPKMEK